MTTMNMDGTIVAKAATKANEVDEKQREREFELALSNAQRIGFKTFVNMPISCLFSDTSFQRTEDISDAKVDKLYKGWDDAMYEPVKISIHKETHSASVLDGIHRVAAAMRRGMICIPCEIAMDEEKSAKRLAKEAAIFAQQLDYVEKLTPQQKHKANILLGVRENVILQKMIDKYDVPMKSDIARGGNSIANKLTGFTAALRVAKRGESDLDNVFKVLYGAMWNKASNGLGKVAIITISNILILHGNEDYVVNALTAMLKKEDPTLMLSKARAKYTERKPMEANMLYIEDYLVENCGIQRVYYGGSVSKYHVA